LARGAQIRRERSRTEISTGGGICPFWSAIHENTLFFDLKHARDGGGGGVEEHAPSGICIEIWASNVTVDQLIGTCAFTFPVERVVPPRAGAAAFAAAAQADSLLPGPGAGSKWGRLDESWLELPVNTGGILECQVFHVSQNLDVEGRQRKRQVGLGQRLSTFFLAPQDVSALASDANKADASGDDGKVSDGEEGEEGEEGEKGIVGEGTRRKSGGGSGREMLLVTVLGGRDIHGAGNGPSAAAPTAPSTGGRPSMVHLRQSMASLGSAIGLGEGQADPYVIAHLMSSTSTQMTLPALGMGPTPTWSTNQQNKMKVGCRFCL
jgi:hypothetical protein